MRENSLSFTERAGVRESLVQDDNVTVAPANGDLVSESVVGSGTAYDADQVDLVDFTNLSHLEIAGGLLLQPFLCQCTGLRPAGYR